MAVPTFLMGLLPTYASLGITASILLVLLRMCQGLAVGGEFLDLVPVCLRSGWIVVGGDVEVKWCVVGAHRSDSSQI